MGTERVGAQERCGHLAPTAGLARVNLALGGTTGSAPAQASHPLRLLRVGGAFLSAPQQLCPRFWLWECRKVPKTVATGPAESLLIMKK